MTRSLAIIELNIRMLFTRKCCLGFWRARSCLRVGKTFKLKDTDTIQAVRIRLFKTVSRSCKIRYFPLVRFDGVVERTATR